MSDEQTNKAILKEAYDKWDATKGGSVDHWMSIMADTIDFRSLADGEGGLNFTKTVETRDELQGYFEGLLGGLEMIHYTVDKYFADGDTVISMGRTAWRVRENGNEFETPKVDVVRFENGKIVAFFEYYDTAKAQAAVQG